MSSPLFKMFSHLPLGLKLILKEKIGQERVTHLTTTIVSHGREKLKRNMINLLLSLTKHHQEKISHQVVTLTIPLLKDQVPLNVLNVWGISTLL